MREMMRPINLGRPLSQSHSQGERGLERLPRGFYRRDPVTLAKALLGQRLVRVLAGRRLAGIIVETEAYLGIPDAAAHTYRGRRTPRVASMWKDGGHAYVYFTYGVHHCLNVVAGADGDPVAVLLRALEPTEGLETMRRLRSFPPVGGKSGGGRGVARAPLHAHAMRRWNDTDLCSGPGKLCQALAIDRSLDGTDLTDNEALFIEPARRTPYASSAIVASPRVGVPYAGEWAGRLLRFYLRGNPNVSRK